MSESSRGAGAEVRLAVAGASHWHTARHVEGFQAGGARVVAVEDADPAVAAAVAEPLGAAVYDDVAAMFDAERPDAALVLGEPRRMALAARAAIERGIPFVAEKPLAPTGPEVLALAEAAERAGVWATVALPNRALSLWQALDELRRDDALGPLSHFAARIVNGPPRRYARWNSAWMLDPTRNGGGGALHNLGIHAVDAFLRLADAGPDEVEVLGAALSSRAHAEPIEDYGVAILRAPNGLVATVEAGYTYPVETAGMTRGGDTAWRVSAARAYLVDADGRLTITRPDGSEEERPSGGGYRTFCLDALARLRGGRPPLATPRDCARAVLLLERIYAAGRA